MAVSDYPLDLILIGYFVQEQDAGTSTKRAAFGQSLYDLYDDTIVASGSAVNPPVSLDARTRATIALMAAHAPGHPQQQAQSAVAAYVTFRGV